MPNWCHVTMHEPCVICGHSDWCAVSTDGGFAVCRRTERDGAISRVDRAGMPYWLYRLHGDATPRQAVPVSPEPTHGGRAAPPVLHRIYSSLLQALTLSPTHLDALRQRGLDDTEIVRRRYSTLPLRGRAALARRLVDQYGEAVCGTVPGFYVAEHASRRWWSLAGAAGLLIPVRNLDGHIACLKVRADDHGAGPKYTTISSAKHGGPSPGRPCTCQCMPSPGETWCG